MSKSLITIENENAFVSIDTIVEFSGNTEKSIRELIRTHKDKIETLGLFKFHAV